MDFFKSLSDQEIYSDKINHIYLYNEINEDSIDELIDNIKKACEIVVENNIIKHPKPILIHINSPGGCMYNMYRCYSIFKDCTVPIATVVDGICASAATFIHMLSPYRIGTEFSLILIHEYSYVTKRTMKMSDSIDISKFINSSDKYNTDIILSRSKMSREQLKKLAKHDLMLDYKFCEKYGLYERIIYKQQRNKSNIDLKFLEIIKDQKTNKINIACKNTADNTSRIKDIMINIDHIIHGNNNTTPIVFKINNNICFSQKIGIITQLLPVYHKINLIQTYTIGFIDTIVSVIDIIPVLTCNKIVMTSTAAIIINIEHIKCTNLVDDSYENVKVILRLLKQLLAFHTKLPNKIIDNIDKKRLYLKPKECLEYGIVNEIINI